MKINAKNMKKYVKAPVKVNECEFLDIGKITRVSYCHDIARPQILDEENGLQI